MRVTLSQSRDTSRNRSRIKKSSSSVSMIIISKKKRKRLQETIRLTLTCRWGKSSPTISRRLRDWWALRIWTNDTHSLMKSSAYYNLRAPQTAMPTKASSQGPRIPKILAAPKWPVQTWTSLPSVSILTRTSICLKLKMWGSAQWAVVSARQSRKFRCPSWTTRRTRNRTMLLRRSLKWTRQLFKTRHSSPWTRLRLVLSGATRSRSSLPRSC